MNAPILNALQSLMAGATSTTTTPASSLEGLGDLSQLFAGQLAQAQAGLGQGQPDPWSAISGGKLLPLSGQGSSQLGLLVEDSDLLKGQEMTASLLPETLDSEAEVEDANEGLVVDLSDFAESPIHGFVIELPPGFEHWLNAKAAISASANSNGTEPGLLSNLEFDLSAQAVLNSSLSSQTGKGQATLIDNASQMVPMAGITAEPTSADDLQQVMQDVLSSNPIEAPESKVAQPQATASFASTLRESADVAGKPSSQPSIETQVAKPGWDKALGKHLSMMIQQQAQIAEIKLNPAHLGPLEVQIKMDGDQASLLFVSAHAEVRQALEHAIPRLRDMLGDTGLALGNVDVSAHSQRDPAQDQGSGQGITGLAGRSGEGQTSDGSEPQAQGVVLMADGLVDYYA